MPLPSIEPLLKTLNVLAVLILLVFNLSLVIPDEIRPKTPFYSLYEGRHSTLLVPSQVFWIIWPLILVMLVCFALYQWVVSQGTEETAIEKGVHVWLAIAALFQGAWMGLWIADELFAAWCMLLLAYVAITRVYVALRLHFRNMETTRSQFFLHAPFSLYHAFLLCLLVLNTYLVLMPGKRGVQLVPGVWSEVFTILGEVFLWIAAIAYVEVGRDDFSAALVMAWYLLCIYIDAVPDITQTPRIRWTAFVLALVALAHSARGPFSVRAPRPVRWLEHASEEEREQLIRAVDQP